MSEPREALAEVLQGMLTPEQLEFLINEVLAVTKKGRAEFNCKHCSRRQVQYAEISDAIAVARALPDLLNQAYGRPQEASVTTEPLRFYRLTNVEDLPENASVSTSKPRTRHRKPRPNTDLGKMKEAS